MHLVRLPPMAAGSGSRLDYGRVITTAHWCL
jgi:hypothetical protein